MQSHRCRARSLSDIDYSLQRETCGQLRRARSKKLLTVWLQIHLGFFLICSLASSRTSFAFHTNNEGQTPKPLFLPIPESMRAKGCESRHSRSYREHYSCRLVAKSLGSQARGERHEARRKRFLRVSPLITLSSAHRAIAAQSFITIHRTAVMASSRSTTVPPIMPAT